MGYTVHLNRSLFLYLYFNYLMSRPAGGPEVLEGTCSKVLQMTSFSLYKIYRNCNFVGFFFHHPICYQLVKAFWRHHISNVDSTSFGLIMITYGCSISEMRIYPYCYFHSIKMVYATKYKSLFVLVLICTNWIRKLIFILGLISQLSS